MRPAHRIEIDTLVPPGERLEKGMLRLFCGERLSLATVVMELDCSDGVIEELVYRWVIAYQIPRDQVKRLIEEVKNIRSAYAPNR